MVIGCNRVPDPPARMIPLIGPSCPTEHPVLSWLHVHLPGHRGAGFIGSNFVRRLLATTDHSVTVLDALSRTRATRRPWPAPEDRFTFVKGSVTDRPLVDALVASHDVVVHFAAESHNDNSLLDRLRSSRRTWWARSFC